MEKIEYKQGIQEPQACCNTFLDLRAWGVIWWNELYHIFEMSSPIKDINGNGRCFGDVKFCPFCGKDISHKKRREN